MATFVALLYAIAVLVFLVVLWRRIGEWDAAHDEIEQRRAQREHPAGHWP
jgi:cytochrome c-type biogenesis protein CcmH/NrfG